MTGGVMQIAVTGIFWYRSAEDYNRFLTIFKDAAKLHPTYAEWLAKAESLEHSLQVAGREFVRDYADPNEFVAWCASHHADVNTHGRTEYANWFAAKTILGDEIT